MVTFFWKGGVERVEADCRKWQEYYVHPARTKTNDKHILPVEKVKETVSDAIALIIFLLVESLVTHVAYRSQSESFFGRMSMHSLVICNTAINCNNHDGDKE